MHGTLSDNLRAAIVSAKRLRTHTVYGDTLKHWRALLLHARSKSLVNGEEDLEIAALVAELESQVQARTHLPER